ncbi:SusC/RagA family TonB-linked outer membrane protein [Sunxiuqinia sp. A32]|uniref:SusC/RagA family TonB-linked outer membrane protein n=1 Tax=Sunxiuqinia sp. A32 TaxID=3461496 RepID=UPI0040457C41
MKKNRMGYKELYGPIKKFLLIMKLSVFISLVSIIQVFAGSSYAQKTKVSVNLENTTIEKALLEIENSSSYKFIYNKQNLDVEALVSIHLNNKSIVEALDVLFQDEKVDYNFYGEQIILTNKGETLFQSNQSVSGKVIDETGMPLPGVTVVVKGTTKGAITDASGVYHLQDVSSDATLVFSFVGMKSEEVTVIGKTEINIVLSEESIGLDEIVAVGYGTMRKSDLTGAVARVGGEDLQKVATVDAIQSLQGKVSGVDITANSGEPGSGVRIRVRGIGSWTNSNPIYIIDGFAVNDASSVEPSNIKSIEILKDASATAIYGSRGANGVVLITTKNGLKGKSNIEVNAYGGLEYTNSLIDMCDATEYAKLRIEAYKNDGNIGLIPQDEKAILDYVIANKLKGTDWQDELINKASVQNYNVSIRGGSENSTYNVGATLFSQDGLVKNSGIDKLFTWANNSYSLSEKVKLDLNISYTHYTKQNHNGDSYFGSLPVALRMDPVTPAWDSYTNNYGARFMGGVVIVSPSLAVDESKYNVKNGNKLLSNVTLNVSDFLFDGLTFNAMYGADLNFNNNENIVPEYWLASDQKRDQSSIYNYRYQSYNWQLNGYFNYNKVIAEDHSVNAMIGAEIQEFNSEWMSATGYDVPYIEELIYLNNARNQETKSIGGSATISRLESFFTRLNYSYKNRYMITATVRADGSSKFLGDNRWGYFPSTSLAWNIKEEGFMDTVNFFDQLKVRLGWGQVGNAASVGNFDYATTMTTGYNYVFGENETIVDGAKAVKLSNEEIRWETSEQLNFGVDALIFNQKLNVTLDYFDKKTKDLQLNKPIPTYVGMNSPTVNAGTMKNYGFELALGWKDKRGDFSYTVNATATMIKNKVVDLAGGDPIYGGGIFRQGSSTRTIEGQEFAYFYGLETDGVFNSEEELSSYTWTNPETNETKLVQPKAFPGDVKFVDRNDDGVIDDLDKTYLGSAFPNISGSLNLSLTYKEFDIQAFVFGVFGSEIVNGMNYNLQSSSILTNYAASRMNRWTDDQPERNEPRMTAVDANENRKFSDLAIEDGSYLRLRNVQIGYTFNSSLIQHIGLSKARIYISGDNLVTLTKYSGWNPEIAGGGLNGGVDYATYPIPSIISAGINVTF